MNRTRYLFSGFLILGILVPPAAGRALAARGERRYGPSQTPSPRSVWDGVYTDAQAKRGQASYEYSCSTCHLPDLEGDPGRDVPPLAGEMFVNEWSRHSAKDLFDLISKAMPKDSPGSLRAQTYVDLIAYLLQANEFPSGTSELTADSAALERIAIEKVPLAR